MLLKPKKTDAPGSLELTPMIDMVFLLLIFFLVATTFHHEEREIAIALPVAQAAGPISTALREVIINVDEQGQVIVSGRSMKLDDLRSLISQAVEVNPDQKVTVRGDRRTAYDNVVKVLDVCKASGIQEPFLDTVLAE
jgi:biopolymer transport protein ExbD